MVQEKNKGVVTDLNGLYSISLSPDDLLEFSFIAFKTQFIIVGVQSVINIAFDPADPSRILVTNSPSFNNFIIDRNLSTPTVFLLYLATLELSYEAVGPGIALFRFLSGASLSFDICSDLVSFTSNGLLGEFGFYEFIFTKQ